jgi:transposase-like protein
LTEAGRKNEGGTAEGLQLLADGLDGHAAYPPAVAQLKGEGALAKNCRHRVGRYLNGVVGQDHRAVKRRVKASQHFRSCWGAWRFSHVRERCS